MKQRRDWRGIVLGAELPPPLRHITWNQVIGGGQEYGDDPLGNEWRRETESGLHGGDEQRDKPRFRMWTTVASAYREGVFLPVFLSIDESGRITDLEIEGYFAACHGRPASVSPQKREEHQVGRLLRSLYRL